MEKNDSFETYIARWTRWSKSHNATPHTRQRHVCVQSNGTSTRWNLLVRTSNAVVHGRLVCDVERSNAPTDDPLRNSYRKGKINILACNSKSATTPDGKEWHFFVVQAMNLDDAWTDPFALFLLGEMVDGWVYCFSDKRNRDRIQEYVLKKS